MGYRSDVVLLISLEDYHDMIDYIPIFYNTIKPNLINTKHFKIPSLEDFTKEVKNILEEGKNNGKIIEDYYILLKWYNIKWYIEDFKDFYTTSYIDKYINKYLTYNEYRFIRLGEDYDDIEISGSLYLDEHDIYVKREIIIT